MYLKNAKANGTLDRAFKLLMNQDLICLDEWGLMFTDEQLAAAIIDRIVHYGHLVNTGNKDCRLEHALMKDK